MLKQRSLIGYHPTSIFVNFSFLLNLKQGSVGDCLNIKIWPWIIWIIWKVRNELLFKGFSPIPADILQRSKLEAEEWFEAHIVEQNFQKEAQFKPCSMIARWKLPPMGWKMCNVGFDWNKLNNLAGGGWVLRNERRVFLCHSRRAFQQYTIIG